jgi:hypothetical protein
MPEGDSYQGIALSDADVQHSLDAPSGAVAAPPHSPQRLKALYVYMHWRHR